MNEKLKYLLSGVLLNSEGATENSITNLQELAGFKLPEDYIDVMKECNGGEGEIGENSWLCLFPIEELLTVNDNYKLLMKQIPDYFLFGKDAADTGYAFHKNAQTLHSFGLMSNFSTDTIDFCGRNFSEFVEFLYNQ